LIQRWGNLKDSLTKEYKQACEVHRDLNSMQDSENLADE